VCGITRDSSAILNGYTSLDVDAEAAGTNPWHTLLPVSAAVGRDTAAVCDMEEAIRKTLVKIHMAGFQCQSRCGRMPPGHGDISAEAVNI
jgi:hypothetical protein